ncbi:TVP38/TMEM64 family protein [Peptostreptococcus porci]|uniref:TVP38/TMEM64 family protein n=1 Tax=Peptostreptococcus porci TaxID=2652282 RepID=UPI002A919FD8|nr:VTT domain-containing protein [Peptostreptococcus porci]MDY5435406.1 VTT domain-containing protein [Peptostreptococcus porci]
MDLINNILYLAKDYFIISILISFFAAFLESFIPALPLLAIVATSAAVNGLVAGFVATWLGSSVGTICVFIFLKKLLKLEMFAKLRKKFESDKFFKASKILEEKGFLGIFAFYTFPFLPSSLLTVASSLCNISYKIFIPPMMFGKFLMMFLISYVGSDIKGFIHSPVKIVVVTLITIATYYIANILKKDLEKSEDNVKQEYVKYISSKEDIKDKYMMETKTKNFLVKQYYMRELIKMIFRIIYDILKARKK